MIWMVQPHRISSYSSNYIENTTALSPEILDQNPSLADLETKLAGYVLGLIVLGCLCTCVGLLIRLAH